ncbi:hypothetical protein EAF04_006369 [Stromatinia cepivora]|nr:hypothetical protein EAF04_006369 [Stromatinia cepivora]
MSPPPPLYLQPEREHRRRRTRSRTHDTSIRSPSLTSTLRSPTTNTSVDSLSKPQVTNQTQYRPHRSRHSCSLSHSTHNTSNKPASHSRSSATFPSTTSLTSCHPSAPTRLPPPPPYTTSSPATVSRASTLISTQAPPIAVAFLNLLDDLGILVLCKPLLELCNVEWISLFDDMGIFYLCEPIGAIRRVLRKLKIGRVDRERGGGSCLGSKSSKSTWEKDTVSWASSLVSEMRSSRSSGSKKHSVSGRRSRGSKGQSTGGMIKDKRSAESASRIGRGSMNGSESANGSERISGTSRRRSERAASSIAASRLGQSLKEIPKEKVVE